MSKDEYKFIMARLNVLDAALECVIKRQAIIARMVAYSTNNKKALLCGLKMSEPLDDYIKAIEKVKEEYEDGSNREG